MVVLLELEITVTNGIISDQDILDVLRNVQTIFINGSAINITDPEIISGVPVSPSRSLLCPILHGSECVPQGNETQCRCGAGLLWDTSTCQALGPCSSDPWGPPQGCSCVRGAPADPFQHNVTIRTTMDFDSLYEDKSSSKYMKMETRFLSALNKSYQRLGERFIKVIILRFRDGSLIVDYQVIGHNLSTEDIINKTEDINIFLKNYEIEMNTSNRLVIHSEGKEISVDGKLTENAEVTLVYNSTIGNTTNVTWSRNGQSVSTDFDMIVAEKLTIRKFQISSNGTYTCQVQVGSFAVLKSSVVLELMPTINQQSGSPPSVSGKKGVPSNVTCCLQQQLPNLTITWSVNNTSTNYREWPTWAATANASKDLDSKVPDLIKELSGYQPDQIPANDVKDVSFVIKLLANVISQNNIPINKTVAEDFFTSVSKVLDITLKVSWDKLNDNDNNSASLLKSVETFVEAISDTQKDFNITTDNIVINGTVYSNNTITPYSKEYVNNKVFIDEDVIKNLTRPIIITSIFFPTLREILGQAAPGNSTNGTTNATTNATTVSIVVSTILKVNSSLSKITMDMNLIPLGRNYSNSKYSCVHWNFKMNNYSGGWSDEGCTVGNYNNETNVLTCICSHLTSFSVLMSPNGDNALSAEEKKTLGYITYVGVSVSMAALVCALIVEAVAWRYVRKQENSRMRHIILINICVSLLFADVWFFVAASEASTIYNTNLCLASTFLMHLGYLSVFFWMLCEGLFLFYLVVIIFSRVPMKHLRAAAFAVGYGAPAVIAVVTIAVTKPRGAYTREGVCWLDWENSRALLSFVVPALVIVGFNTIILVVVLTKILRRRSVSAAISESPSVRVKQLAKSIAVMMPVLGVTWGLGIFAFTEAGRLNYTLHILFTIFNSLQGLFIFLFDCLMDIEVRKAIKKVTGINLVARHEGSSSQGPHGKSRSTGMTDPRLKTKVKGTVRDRVRQSGPTLPSLSTSNYDSLVSE
ncbi:unnamed protein product [Lampetra fluviatilis]